MLLAVEDITPVLLTVGDVVPDSEEVAVGDVVPDSEEAAAEDVGKALDSVERLDSVEALDSMALDSITLQDVEPLDNMESLDSIEAEDNVEMWKEKRAFTIFAHLPAELIYFLIQRAFTILFIRGRHGKLTPN